MLLTCGCGMVMKLSGETLRCEGCGATAANLRVDGQAVSAKQFDAIPVPAPGTVVIRPFRVPKPARKQYLN